MKSLHQFSNKKDDINKWIEDKCNNIEMDLNKRISNKIEIKSVLSNILNENLHDNYPKLRKLIDISNNYINDSNLICSTIVETIISENFWVYFEPRKETIEFWAENSITFEKRIKVKEDHSQKSFIVQMKINENLENNLKYEIFLFVPPQENLTQNIYVSLSQSVPSWDLKQLGLLNEPIRPNYDTFIAELTYKSEEEKSQAIKITLTFQSRFELDFNEIGIKKSFSEAIQKASKNELLLL